MRYSYHTGAERKKKKTAPILLGVGLLVAGSYILLTSLAPAIPDWTGDVQATAKKLTVTQPTVGDNRLYIPQINVDVAVVEVEKGQTEAAALDRGAIHRAPENGNPSDGGNYVLAAHRFTMGATPQQTRLKSPFYHINELAVGDQLYLDYNGTRYVYKVTEKKQVAATQVSIESRTEEPQLTLYSCTLSGARDGREVIIAKPVGTVQWQDGTPKIKSNN